ncbi:MAG: hypothetical protein RIE74_04610 [Pseudomonadales bacterium]
MRPSIHRTAHRILGGALLALLALLAHVGIARAADDADAFDILGFRLGMTQAEVDARFRQLNPDVELKVRQATYRYSDGLNEHQTEAFLDRIEGIIKYDRATKEILQVTVQFSPPPDGGRVMQVMRNERDIVNPVTLAEYRQALIGKYGPPTRDRNASIDWFFPAGTAPCSNSASGPAADQLNTMIQGTAAARERMLADPSMCPSFLTFRVQGDPVRSGFARLVDVPNALRTLQAANAWVAQQQADAEARRKAAGRGPQL